MWITRVCSAIHLLKDIWVVYSLGLTHEAAMNVCIQVFVWTFISFSSGWIEWKGGDHVVDKCLTFKEASKLFSKVVVPFSIDTGSVSVQFSSVVQLYPTLCDPMNRSTPGLPVHHQLLEFTQNHVHRVGDAIQPSHPLSSPSPPAPNPSQHQGLFQWVNSWYQVASSV